MTLSNFSIKQMNFICTFLLLKKAALFPGVPLLFYTAAGGYIPARLLHLRRIKSTIKGSASEDRTNFSGKPFRADCGTDESIWLGKERKTKP